MEETGEAETSPGGKTRRKEMRIRAIVRITNASKKEQEEILKLFKTSEGGLTPVPVEKILTPTVRFGDQFQTMDLPYGGYDMSFEIFGVV